MKIKLLNNRKLLKYGMISMSSCLATSLISITPSHAMDKFDLSFERGSATLRFYKNSRSDVLEYPNLSVPPDFNSATYYAINPDFNHAFAAQQARVFGLNYPERSDLLGRWHYANYGRAIGSPYMPADFNSETYYALNPGFNHAFAAQQARVFGLNYPERSDLLGRWHYANYGRAIGSPYMPADFNSAIYYALNPDFNHAFAADQAKCAGLKLSAGSDQLGRWHYANFGRAEGRRYR